MVLTVFGLAVSAISYYLIAADHNDSPKLGLSPSDITDVYAFQSPSNANNIVFALNVNGLLSPMATQTAEFDEDVMLEINIDNSTNKDNIEDLVIQATFKDGMVQVYGPVAPAEKGATSMLMMEDKMVEAKITPYSASNPIIGENNGIKVFAGPREDPFFFDLGQFKKVIGGMATSFNNPGTDTFKGTNVMSFVVELPKSMVGTGTINIWATTNREK